MNKTELKEKLAAHGVGENYYSLEGALLPDRVVLYRSYDKWIVFYFDERGKRNNEVEFESEEAANQYIYDLFRKNWRR